MPPPPPAYPVGYPVPAAKTSTTNQNVLIGIGITLLILVGFGVVAGLGSAARRADDRAQNARPLGTGDCVARGSGASPYHRVTCGDDEIGTVVAAFPGTEQDAQGCPAETDMILVKEGQVACALSTTDEHLGRAGAGGGIVMAGDCVTMTRTTGGTMAQYSEAPCESPKAYEKVTARATAPAGCQAPAVRFMQLQTTVRPVVCLADGPGIAGVGECVADPETVGSFDAAPCGRTAAKVLARRPTKEACETVPGMTYWMEDGAGLPASRYVCLHELKR